MTFERARNEENKRIRMEQIKSAAKKLFDELDYHEITLSKIGDEINFTRGNLYKYITSKEDIYLYVVIDEMTSYVGDMEDNLMQTERLSTKEFAHKWATIFANYTRYMKLMSILLTVIEQNANLDLLVYFKNQLAEIQARIYKIIAHNLPEFDSDDILKLANLSAYFSIGIAPLFNPTEIQKEALRLSKYEYTFPDFVESYSDTLVLLINGIKVSKMSV